MEITSLENIKTSMGDRIRALRADAGLSQRKLALLVGADNTYISRLERGLVNNPTLKFLHRIASALGVELKELFD